MVTTIEEYNKQLQFVIDDIKARVCGGESTSPPHFQAYNMDKPIHVLTANVEDYKEGLIDKGDYYEMMYPRFGSLQKSYTNNFCWIIDEDTVFVIERPFKNRVVRLLKNLLPNHKVHYIKNDIMIDNCKIGPTCMAGQINDWTIQDNPKTSSLIYCLRWSNVEGLDEYFAGDPNHEARKNDPTKGPMTSLDKFLNISREEFMNLLESENLEELIEGY